MPGIIISVLLLILCVTPKVRAEYTVDLFVDFETGTIGNTPSVTTFNACTSGIANWTESSPSPLVTALITSDTSQLRGPVKIGAATYNGTGGTRGVSFSTLGQESVTYYLPEGKTAVSIGMYFKNTIDAGYTEWDWIVVYGVNGDFLSPNQAIAGSDAANAIRAHTPSGKGADIVMHSNTLYWLTIKWVANGSGYVALYDPVTWTQVGITSTLGGIGNTTAERFKIGTLDGHDDYRAGSVYYDNMLIDWTDAKFPLLPDPLSPTGAFTGSMN